MPASIRFRPAAFLAGSFVVVSAAWASPPAFTPLSCPAAPRSLAASLAEIPSRTPGFPHGGVLLSWCERAENEVTLRCAAWDGARWSPVSAVAHGPRLQANWADPPGVMIGAASAGSPWLAHWTEERDGADEAADILLAASLDGGGTWGPAMVPYDETTPAERGFATMTAAGGQVGRVWWLDARHRPSGESAPALKPGPGMPEPPGTELRAADLGIGQGRDGVPHLRVLSSRVLDTRTCDCCPLTVVSWPSVSSARTMAFYRDRSAAEVRDIAAVTLVPGREPVVTPFSADGWKIDGCPVNGPSAVAVPSDGKSVALVVWFTSAADSPRVFAALADSSGGMVGAPLRLDAGRAAGRCSLVALHNGTWVVGWFERRGTAAAFKVALLRRRGGMLARGATPIEIPLASARQTPRLAALGNQVVVAWTDEGPEKSSGRPGVRLGVLTWNGAAPVSR